jgi:hypothetical protein
MKRESTEPAASESAEDNVAVRSVIDRALTLLNDSDRSAVAMHYLQGATVADVANALGVTPEAARKRIERAIVKLRGRMARLGVELAPAGLAAALSGAASVRAPEGLTASTAASVARETPEALGAASDALKAMTRAKLKAAAVPVVVLAIGAAGTGLGLMPRLWADARPRPTVVPATAATAVGSTDARAVLAAFAEAVRTGDGERAIAFAHVTDPPRQQPLLDRASESIRLVAQLKSAFRESAGDGEAAKLPWIFGPQSVPPDAPTSVDGDRATVTMMQRKVPLVRVGQTWKLPASDTAQWVVPITNIRRASEVLTVEEATELARQNNLAYASVLASTLAGEFATSEQLMASLTTRQSAAYETMRGRFPATTRP